MIHKSQCVDMCLALYLLKLTWIWNGLLVQHSTLISFLAIVTFVHSSCPFAHSGSLTLSVQFVTRIDGNPHADIALYGQLFFQSSSESKDEAFLACAANSSVQVANFSLFLISMRLW